MFVERTTACQGKQPWLVKACGLKMVLVHPAPMWDSGGCSQGCPEHGTNTKCAARCRVCISVCSLGLQQVFIVLLILYKTCFLRDFPTQGL